MGGAAGCPAAQPALPAREVALAEAEAAAAVGVPLQAAAWEATAQAGRAKAVTMGPCLRRHSVVGGEVATEKPVGTGIVLVAARRWGNGRSFGVAMGVATAAELTAATAV